MSDIRFNQWLHQSGTGGVSQSDGGHVGIGTTNPLIPVGAGNTHILNVGVVTCNNISAGSSITAGTFYGSGANLTSIPATQLTGNIDTNGDLNVDGHTDLDNVSIAGVTTFTGRSDHSSLIQMLAGNPIRLLNDANSASCEIDCYGGAAFRLTSYNQTMFTCENGGNTKFYTDSGTSRLEITHAGDVIVNTGTLQIPDALQHLGDSNTKIRFPANDTITFETAGSERLQIRADGRTQIKSGDFEVIGGEGANAEFRLTADEGDEGSDYWRFQSAASNNKLKIATYASGSWVDKFNFDTSGNLEVVDGNLVIGTSGHGIDFSATPSNGTSELLDDYEEGTFTLNTVSGGFSSIAGTGTYTIIGRVCIFQGDFSLVGSGNGNVLKMNGLPVVASDWTSCSGYFQHYSNEGSQQASFAIRGNTNDISVVEYGSEMAGNTVSAGYMNVAGCYQI